jgi:GAF domain-containing protein
MQISASWGIATYGADGADLTALFAVADERLLRDKATARAARPAAGIAGSAYVPRGRRTMAEALSSLLEMARNVAAAVDGDEFLRRAATRSAELIGAESCAVAIIRGEERWGYRARRSPEGWTYSPAQFPTGRSMLGRVMETGQPYFSNDQENDPYINKEAARRLGSYNSLCVPLRGSDGAPIGTVFLANKLGRAPFTEQDTVLVQAFADLAVTALEKTEALAAVREEAAVSKSLLGAIDVVHRAGDPDQIVAHIVREAMALIDAEIGAVALVQPDAMLDITSFRREGTPIHGPPRLRVGEGITGHVAATGRPYLSNDLGADPLTISRDDERYGLRSQLSAPVHDMDGAVLGVVSLFNACGDGFTTRHLELLQAFARHAAIALDRASTVREAA